MTLEEYVDDIKLELTGGVLELEISDEIIAKTVQRALKEVQRYIDTTKLVTVPYVPCIDLTDFNCSAVVDVFRIDGYTGDSLASGGIVDPMYAQQWMVFSNGGTMYNLNNYVMNYLSYNTLLQMRNTTSTDLSFREDKVANKLYINVGYDRPQYITIEYVPKFLSVEDITSDYWVDILYRLSLALVKVVLGRLRTRFTQSNALYTQDGETMLAEGTEELTTIRDILRNNSNLFYPLD